MPGVSGRLRRLLGPLAGLIDDGETALPVRQSAVGATP
jgi:hypothetical protein